MRIRNYQKNKQLLKSIFVGKL